MTCEQAATEKKACNVLEGTGASAAHATIYAHKLHPISRLTLVHQVIIQDNVDASGKLTCWCAFRHLLNANPLVVSERAETKLCFEDVPFIVCLGSKGRCWGLIRCRSGRVAVLSHGEQLGFFAIMDGAEHLWTD